MSKLFRSSVSRGVLLLLAAVLVLPAWSAADDKADFHIEKLEFREARVVDAARVIAELSGVNIVTTSEAGQKTFNLFLQDISVRDAIDTLSKVTGLWYRYDGKTRAFRIMTTAEYQNDIVVFREDVTRVFTLMHQNVVSAAQTIQNLFGERVTLALDAQDQSASGFGVGGTGITGGSSGINRRPTSGSLAADAAGRHGGSGQQRSTIRNLTLSPEQLSMLSQAVEDGQLRISEQDLMGFTQRETPIYVTVNQLHNLLVIRTSDQQALTDIVALIREIDRRPPQVLLEMKVLELTLGDAFRSVFDFDFTSAGTAGGPATDQARNPLSPGVEGEGPNLALGLGNFALEGGSFLFQLMNDRIRVRLQLLESDNRVNVLATPMLLASNNSPARLFIGEERVLTTGVSTSTTTGSTGTAVSSISAETEVRDIGNTLLILPRINADRTVTLNIQQDSSSVLVGGATIPVAGAAGAIQEFPIDTVNTANLTGTVLAKDGLTVAVGGMIRTSESNSTQKMPLLGDVPLLGRIFRREVREQFKTELVLLITPHVFTTVDEAEQRGRERLESLSNHYYLEK